MHALTQARARLDAARSLPDQLNACRHVFEQALVTIREHEERHIGLVAAFMLAAASAADGRDVLLTAPSLPWPPPADPPRSEPGGRGHPIPDTAINVRVDQIADALADLSQLTAAVLATAASHARHPADQSACTEAALCARAVWTLLAWPGP